MDGEYRVLKWNGEITFNDFMAKVKQKYIVRWLFEAKIYALTDNDDNVFYVGCTLKSLKLRLIQHISATKTHDGWANSRKNEKIRSLNYQVKIKELESFAVFGKEKREAQRNAAMFENRWINTFLSEGIELTNCIIPKQRQKGNSKAA